MNQYKLFFTFKNGTDCHANIVDAILAGDRLRCPAIATVEQLRRCANHSIFILTAVHDASQTLDAPWTMRTRCGSDIDKSSFTSHLW